MHPIITYGSLSLAITLEVIATSLLPHTREFTRPLPTLATLALYGLAFYLLTIVTRVLPIGIVYALWSGMGIVLVAGLNHFFFRQSLDFPAILGISLIVLGVIIINVFSSSVSH